MSRDVSHVITWNGSSQPRPPLSARLARTALPSLLPSQPLPTTLLLGSAQTSLLRQIAGPPPLPHSPRANHALAPPESFGLLYLPEAFFGMMKAAYKRNEHEPASCGHCSKRVERGDLSRSCESKRTDIALIVAAFNLGRVWRGDYSGRSAAAGFRNSAMAQLHGFRLSASAGYLSCCLRSAAVSPPVHWKRRRRGGSTASNASIIL